MPVPSATKVKSLSVHPRGYCTLFPFHRPWYDLSNDFITGLPLSQGNTTIIADRFSKAAQFIPLPKLPTTFCYKAFFSSLCQSLETSVSLSSGFHSESNGQTERLNQDLDTTLRYMPSNNLSSSYSSCGRNTLTTPFAPMLQACPLSSASSGILY